eukprot:4026355-Prymnesium_polylepis.1
MRARKQPRALYQHRRKPRTSLEAYLLAGSCTDLCHVGQGPRCTVIDTEHSHRPDTLTRTSRRSTHARHTRTVVKSAQDATVRRPNYFGLQRPAVGQ